jgi:hypothetical protein
MNFIQPTTSLYDLYNAINIHDLLYEISGSIITFFDSSGNDPYADSEQMQLLIENFTYNFNQPNFEIAPDVSGNQTCDSLLSLFTITLANIPGYEEGEFISFTIAPHNSVGYAPLADPYLFNQYISNLVSTPGDGICQLTFTQPGNEQSQYPTYRISLDGGNTLYSNFVITEISGGQFTLTISGLQNALLYSQVQLQIVDAYNNTSEWYVVPPFTCSVPLKQVTITSATLNNLTGTMDIVFTRTDDLDEVSDYDSLQVIYTRPDGTTKTVIVQLSKDANGVYSVKSS